MYRQLFIVVYFVSHIILISNIISVPRVINIIAYFNSYIIATTVCYCNGKGYISLSVIK